MSQFSKGLSERRLAFIDRNKELWLCPVVPPTGSTGGKAKSAAAAKHKLHTQVGGGWVARGLAKGLVRRVFTARSGPAQNFPVLFLCRCSAVLLWSASLDISANTRPVEIGEKEIKPPASSLKKVVVLFQNVQSARNMLTVYHMAERTKPITV